MKVFWLLLVIVAIIWYSTITALVAFKGAFDIKNMFIRMSDKLKLQGESSEKGKEAMEKSEDIQ